MSTPSTIYIDPGSTDAIPVYLVVSSGVNTYMPRAVLNDSSGNEITAGNPLPVAGNATVYQGTNPWLVNASVVGQQAVVATVSAPLPVVATYAAPWQVIASQNGVWGVSASLVGAPLVTATLPLGATVYQGTTPWAVIGTVAVTGGITAVITNVTLASLATVFQGGAPWTANVSIQGTPTTNTTILGTVPVSGTFWQTTQPVVASVVGAPAVVASVSGFASVQADSGAVGASTYLNTSLVATCVTVKTGNANLYGYHFYNSGSSVAFISLFAQTLATMGKTSASAILAVPAGGWADNLSDLPVAYSQGLLVGASASINGTGNPASPVLANVYFK